MKRKNLLFIACISLTIVLVVIALLAGICDRVHRKAIEVQIDPTQPVVALTFDDGPNARYTPQVLDILYEHQVPATFFLVGEKFSGNELLIQEMEASGHEIGNHTFSHSDLTTLDQAQIQQEIKKTEAELEKILPDYHMKYVRPPYGRYTEQVEDEIDRSLMLWTIDSGDWNKPDTDNIYAAVIGNIQHRDIIVFHDDNTQTVQVLEKIIMELKRREVQFATVSQFERCMEMGSSEKMPALK